MKFLVRDKSFYRRFFAMALALALQQLLNFSVNLADNFMLGAYSEAAMAGSSVGSQVQYVLQLLCVGLSNGVVVLGSRSWGRRETEPIRLLFGTGWKLTVGVGFLFFLLTKFFPATVMSLFTSDPAVTAQGLAYLRLASWSYLVFPLAFSLSSFLRCVETTHMGPILAVTSLVSNVTLNYLFIFGKGGAPAMGAAGAALATLISRCLEALILFVYLFFIDKKLHLRLRDLLTPRFYDLRRYFRVAAPSAAGLSLFALGTAAQSAVLGHVSDAAMAANSIMTILWQIFSVVGITCAGASSVIIGKTIGEGRREDIPSYAKTLQCLYVLIGLVSATALLLCRGPIMSLYDLSPQTMSLARDMSLVLCIIVFACCYQYPISSGIIQGGGNTVYSLVVDGGGLWLFALPLGYLSAFVFHWPILVTFFLLRSDQLLKCLINGYWVNCRQWLRDV